MAGKSEQLAELLKERFGDQLAACTVDLGQVTIEVPREHQLEVCRRLRDDRDLAFAQLSDLCGVDYMLYGTEEWATEESTSIGYSRGVEARTSARMGIVERDLSVEEPTGGRRFAAVTHLLSLEHNRRLRVRVFAPDDDLPMVHSVAHLWAAANWFEREAFDLFGIVFDGHPDLRRLLTDYGFLGHPFRKDFPLSGNVEVRYDAERQRVVYEPVSIEPRVLVPRVIRHERRRNEPAPGDEPQGRENEGEQAAAPDA